MIGVATTRLLVGLPMTFALIGHNFPAWNRGQMRLHQIGIASPVMAMEAFLERHQPWIEAVVGCPRAETLTLECEIPFSHLVLEQLLADVNLDRQCLTAAEALRPIIKRWETPPGCSPRLELVASRDRRARVTERKLAWDPHWKETPIAIWLQGAHHAIVTADIPYVSYIEKGDLSWRQWTIVNRREAALCLNLIRQVVPPSQITVIGGRDIPLPEHGYNWDSVILDPVLNQMVRHDYETFWETESWFEERKLPYKRGFLLYGPPGNGKRLLFGSWRAIRKSLLSASTSRKDYRTKLSPICFKPRRIELRR